MLHEFCGTGRVRVGCHKVTEIDVKKKQNKKEKCTFWICDNRDGGCGWCWRWCDGAVLAVPFTTVTDNFTCNPEADGEKTMAGLGSLTPSKKNLPLDLKGSAFHLYDPFIITRTMKSWYYAKVQSKCAAAVWDLLHEGAESLQMKASSAKTMCTSDSRPLSGPTCCFLNCENKAAVWARGWRRCCQIFCREALCIFTGGTNLLAVRSCQTPLLQN